jgi:hypothetical protein
VDVHDRHRERLCRGVYPGDPGGDVDPVGVVEITEVTLLNRAVPAGEISTDAGGDDGEQYHQADEDVSCADASYPLRPSIFGGQLFTRLA